MNSDNDLLTYYYHCFFLFFCNNLHNLGNVKHVYDDDDDDVGYDCQYCTVAYNMRIWTTVLHFEM